MIAALPTVRDLILSLVMGTALLWSTARAEDPVVGRTGANATGIASQKKLACASQ